MIIVIHAPDPEIVITEIEEEEGTVVQEAQDMIDIPGTIDMIDMKEKEVQERAQEKVEKEEIGVDINN